MRRRTFLGRLAALLAIFTPQRSQGTGQVENSSPEASETPSRLYVSCGGYKVEPKVIARYVKFAPSPECQAALEERFQRSAPICPDCQKKMRPAGCSFSTFFCESCRLVDSITIDWTDRAWNDIRRIYFEHHPLPGFQQPRKSPGVVPK